MARHAARRSEVAAATDLAERSREGAKQVTLLESYEVRRALVRTLKVTMSLFPADHDPPGWQPPASSRTS